MTTIVVGVDGSAGARAALRWAVSEAELRRVDEVAVTMVLHAPSVSSLPDVTPIDRQQLREIAAARLDRLLADEGLTDRSGARPRVVPVPLDGPIAVVRDHP